MSPPVLTLKMPTILPTTLCSPNHLNGSRLAVVPPAEFDMPFNFCLSCEAEHCRHGMCTVLSNFIPVLSLGGNKIAAQPPALTTHVSKPLDSYAYDKRAEVLVNSEGKQ